MTRESPPSRRSAPLRAIPAVSSGRERVSRRWQQARIGVVESRQVFGWAVPYTDPLCGALSGTQTSPLFCPDTDVRRRVQRPRQPQVSKHLLSLQLHLMHRAISVMQPHASVTCLSVRADVAFSDSQRRLFSAVCRLCHLSLLVDSPTVAVELCCRHHIPWATLPVTANCFTP